MSGHSKWSNIQAKKGVADAKRAREFAQLAKDIRIAVKSGGNGDPASNASLRMWMDKARAANMPKDKIQRAIDVGLGKGAGGVQIQEINYEAFGPDGVGMIIMAATDNVNRTSSELKALLTRAGGAMGGPGSVGYMFNFNKETQSYICQMPIAVGSETREKVEKLIDGLVEIEGVEEIFTTLPAEESEEMMEGEGGLGASANAASLDKRGE